MSETRLSPLSVAAALAGAIALVGLPASDAGAQAKNEKCYGIAKAGENGCANAAGTHSCAGNSTVNFSGQDWKLVPSGTCEQVGGKTRPFEGTGTPKP